MTRRKLFRGALAPAALLLPRGLRPWLPTRDLSALELPGIYEGPSFAAMGGDPVRGLRWYAASLRGDILGYWGTRYQAGLEHEFDRTLDLLARIGDRHLLT